MTFRVLVGSVMVVALMGLGMLVGGIVGTGDTSAQTATGTPQQTTPNTAPTTAPNSAPNSAPQAKITQQQAEQAALAASPGNTVDHSRLGKDQNGTIFWDVDFTNGGGVTINANTGAVIAKEAAGTDHPGGHFGGPGGRGAPGAPPATQP